MLRISSAKSPPPLLIKPFCDTAAENKSNTSQTSTKTENKPTKKWNRKCRCSEQEQQ